MTKSQIPPTIRKALRTRASIDDYPCCEMCGKPGANNAHHRRNQSQGGRDTLSNLLLLCGSGTTGCHGFVTTEPQIAKRMGWTVRRISEPEDIGVWRFDHTVGTRVCVLLDDQGNYQPVESAA